jgi:hypothetical protein
VVSAPPALIVAVTLALVVVMALTTGVVTVGLATGVTKLTVSPLTFDAALLDATAT